MQNIEIGQRGRWDKGIFALYQFYVRAFGLARASLCVCAVSLFVGRQVLEVHGTVRRVANALNTLQSVTRRVTVPQAPHLAAAHAALLHAQTQAAATPGSPGFAAAAPAASAASAAAAAAASPLTDLWPAVLPNCVVLVQSLHGVWGAECSQQLRASPATAHVLGMSDQEVTTQEANLLWTPPNLLWTPPTSSACPTKR